MTIRSNSLAGAPEHRDVPYMGCTIALRRLLPFACALVACASRSAFAQGCDSVVSRTSLAELSGRTVKSVAVELRDVASLPGVPAAVDRLHSRTRDATIRRMVLVHAGERLDTLLAGESLRRLRQVRYLRDPQFRAVSCENGTVDLTVVAQDVWSVKPSLQLRSNAESFSITERNLLGTGREVSIGLKSDAYGLRASAGLHDPWFLGRDISLDLSTSGDGERGSRSIAIGRRERSVSDAIVSDVRFESSQFDFHPNLLTLPTDAYASIRRAGANANVAWRAHYSDQAVYHLGTGVEYDLVGGEAANEGHVTELREFAGIDATLRRRSVAYDTVTWLLPNNGLADIPLSLEFDALVAPGYDMAFDAAAVHADAWAGRMWLLNHTSLLVADGWASGFRSHGAWTAGSLRASLAFDRAAWRGLWNVRVGSEHWFGADPDMRTVFDWDPTLGAINKEARIEPASFSASLERSVRIRRVTRTYSVGVAAFAATSTRDAANVNVAGIGLRVEPTRIGRATVRLDVAMPMSSTGAVRTRPFVALSVTPWLEQDRHRDGRPSR